MCALNATEQNRYYFTGTFHIIMVKVVFVVYFLSKGLNMLRFIIRYLTNLMKIVLAFYFTILASKEKHSQ